MITVKLPYYTDCTNDSYLILDYIKQYSSCLHFMYNRVRDGISETEIKHLFINNVDLLDSWFKQSCVKEAAQIHIISKDKKVIFGGKANYLNRLNNRISKEEYKSKRLSALYSIGEGSNPDVKSNRKFAISPDLSVIVFKPNRNTKINLYLPKLKKNYLETIKKLYYKQEEKNFSISYKLDTKYIYIFFDEIVLKANVRRNIVKDRVIAIDLNPNYIGWSVVDWANSNSFDVVKSGVFSLKHLNDIEREYKQMKLPSTSDKRIYLSDKRNFEVLQISKQLIKTGLYYGVEVFGMEDIKMSPSDKEKGKLFNRLVNNNWIRDKFVNNLIKRCNIHGIKIQKVKPEYSSFIGNVLYRHLKLPDMVLSSIEVGRRTYEFYNQYIIKTKQINKNIIIPSKEFYEPLIFKSLEEFEIKEKYDNLVDLYYVLKKSKFKYRISLDELNLKFLRQKHKKYQFVLT